MSEQVKVTVITQIVDYLKQKIINSDYKIEQKLPAELTLSKSLNVSRSSVREALYKLQAEGYVKLIPGKGAFVQSDKPENNKDLIREWFISSAPTLEEYMEVRMCIAPLAASLASERSSDEELNTLKMIHADFEKANNSNDISSLVSLDEAFHEQIFLMSHNVFLCKIGEMLTKLLKQYRLMSISSKESSSNTVEEHKTILDAIAQRDKNRAQTAMQLHLYKALDGIYEAQNKAK